jgi:hypothetical protein
MDKITNVARDWKQDIMLDAAGHYRYDLEVRP